MAATMEATRFELVEEHKHVAPYGDEERRRSWPLVSLSDCLAESRRGIWSATMVRIVAVMFVWLGIIVPRLAPGHTRLIVAVTAFYVMAEVAGIGLVLRHLAQIARAATRY